MGYVRVRTENGTTRNHICIVKQLLIAWSHTRIALYLWHILTTDFAVNRLNLKIIYINL